MLQLTFRAFLCGLPGLAAVLLLVEAPNGIPRFALIIGPAILLLLASFVGARLSKTVGANSIFLSQSQFNPPDLYKSFCLGLVLGSMIAFLDQTLLSVWRIDALSLKSLIEFYTPNSFVLGIFYGGLTEEVIFRWGTATLIAYAISQFVPLKTAVTAAVLISAALFAAAHLPAAMGELESWPLAAVVRTLGWNFLLGLVFGTLFFRNNLESAILAHVGFHCGAAIAAILYAIYMQVI